MNTLGVYYAHPMRYTLFNPEPIMPLVLPIIPARISHSFTHYSYIIPMPSPIIPIMFFKFLLSVTMRSTFCLIADKWVHLV